MLLTPFWDNQLINFSNLIFSSNFKIRKGGGTKFEHTFKLTFYSEMAMPDLQWYSWNLYLIKYKFALNVFVSLNCLFSFAIVSLQKWLAHFYFIRSYEKVIRFSSQKTILSSTFLIRLRFQGYRCKSDIAIFHDSHLKLRLQSH